MCQTQQSPCRSKLRIGSSSEKVGSPGKIEISAYSSHTVLDRTVRIADELNTRREQKRIC